jgi:hypothetical protein
LEAIRVVSVPLPTFVIAGAQKSGTTTLHDLLAQHPQIQMSDPKELHFFDKPRGRTLDDYADLFQPGSGHRAWGESTPFYLYNDRARQAMTAALPKARFVVILREPVSRAYSHYWFARSKGREPLGSFEQAVAAEPDRLASSKDGQPAAFSYLDRGHYLRQLTDLESRVGRDRLLVLLTEDLAADPLRVVNRTCEFLGLGGIEADQLTVRSLNTFAERVVNTAEGRAKERVQTRHVASADAYPSIDSDLERDLRARFSAENRELANWLGRDLSAWLPS